MSGWVWLYHGSAAWCSGILKFVILDEVGVVWVGGGVAIGELYHGSTARCSAILKFVILDEVGVVWV